MSYTEIKGNLLEMTDKFDVICHGANCKQLMGVGIALQIKNKYPVAYEIDRNDTRGPLQRLGDMTILKNEDLTVVNLYTQYNPGNNLNYTALRLGLFKVNQKFTNKKIGLPLIGCGIAGGNWPKVRQIIKEELKDCEVTVVIFNESDLGEVEKYWWQFWK